MAVNLIPPSFKAGAVGDLYRCSVQATTPFGIHVNTWHVRQQTAAPFNNDAFADINDHFTTLAKTAYLALFDSQFSLTGLRVSRVDGNLTGLPSSTYAQSGTGTRVDASERLPGQNAALIDYTSGFSGRRGRARQFIGLLHEADQSGGILVAGTLTVLNSFGQALRNAYGLTSNSYPLVAYTAITNTAIDITGHAARSPVYTQRRRRAGVGS
jgi:hypothetical protein